MGEVGKFFPADGREAAASPSTTRACDDGCGRGADQPQMSKQAMAATCLATLHATGKLPTSSVPALTSLTAALKAALKTRGLTLNFDNGKGGSAPKSGAQSADRYAAGDAHAPRDRYGRPTHRRDILGTPRRVPNRQGRTENPFPLRTAAAYTRTPHGTHQNAAPAPPACAARDRIVTLVKRRRPASPRSPPGDHRYAHLAGALHAPLTAPTSARLERH